MYGPYYAFMEFESTLAQFLLPLDHDYSWIVPFIIIILIIVILQWFLLFMIVNALGWMEENRVYV